MSFETGFGVNNVLSDKLNADERIEDTNYYYHGIPPVFYETYSLYHNSGYGYHYKSFHPEFFGGLKYSFLVSSNYFISVELTVSLSNFALYYNGSNIPDMYLLRHSYALKVSIPILTVKPHDGN